MIIVFDKNTDPNIDKIISGSVEGDIFYWNEMADNGWVWDSVNFRVRVGGADTDIYFKNANGLEPYLRQFSIARVQVINPFKGVNEDPFYDMPMSGTLVSHSYTYTDVEAEAKKPK